MPGTKYSHKLDGNFQICVSTNIELAIVSTLEFVSLSVCIKICTTLAIGFSFRAIRVYT